MLKYFAKIGALAIAIALVNVVLWLGFIAGLVWVIVWALRALKVIH